MKGNKSFASKLNVILRDLETTLRNGGDIGTSAVAKGAYSQEDMTSFNDNVNDETRGLRSELAPLFAELDESFSQEAMAEDMSESMKAGVIAALGSQNASKYHKKALSNSGVHAGMSLESIYSGTGGEIDTTDQYSQESFDETDLANFAAQNIMFNVLASRQDGFAEAFFPTKVVTAAEGGIKITVDRQEIIDNATHKTDGSAISTNRKNLMEAFADHSILSRPATDLVPFARPDNSADANFVSDSDVGTVNLAISGQTVATRPLAMGKKINLLGLSQHPGLIENGVLDTTDQIAPGMRLNKIYVKIDDGSSAEVIAINLANLNRNQFKKSHEGEGREVALNFISNLLPLDKNTVTTAGAASVLLASVINTPDLVASLSINVSGNANLNSGQIDLHASPIRVEAVTNAAKDSISLDAGAGKAVVDALAALSATVIGFDLAARRSNSNWRTTGALIDVTPYTESYAIEPGYPISVLTPSDESQNGIKISGMINAARIRNSNNAITTLFNYADQLEAFTESLARGVDIDIVGAGRHIIKPYFFADSIDVDARVDSISTHERAEDVAKVLVLAIRDAAYRMYRESNYGPALDLANAGTETKPILLIGVDAVVARHLNVVADERLMGDMMDFRIVQTNDNRMTDEIFMTFTRERPGSEDGLSFGVHGYIPELIQRVSTNRNGSVSKNDRVVPRSIHVPVLPCMTKLTVVNLKKALTGA